MKRIVLTVLCFLSLVAGALSSEIQVLHKEIRQIRRAYLDVLGLVPTPEEVDWYVVYNHNGYMLAVDFLIQHKNSNGWTRDALHAPNYLNQPERDVEQEVLERNVVYLAGLWKGEFSGALFEVGADKFIKDALLASDDNVANAINYMINGLTCRPASAAEENEMFQLFNKVSLKASEMDAWRTILLHILKLPDCRFK